MTNKQLLFCLTDKCDIYFEDSLISKELIVKKYADFFASNLKTDDHSVSIALHTGSVCFKIVSILVATLACLSFDKTNSESIIASLKKGDIVLFRNKRYRWRGVDSKNGIKYIKMEQDGRGKHGKTTSWFPYENNKHLITPYYGTSNITDGRGIRKRGNKRADFISYVLGIPVSEVPSISGASVVIVSERSTFERISKGLRISYRDNFSVGLLDIVTASYYTENGEEYQVGSNPAKIEPVLKITRKISTARDLILENHNNQAVGLAVIDEEAVSKGSSELNDLLRRKNLKFSHIAIEIDSECAEDIVQIQENAPIFACTKEFLLENSLPPKEKNSIILELDRQIENILNYTLQMKIVEGGCSFNDYRKFKETLHVIRKSQWNESDKSSFLINAYSLFNLFNTAVFPIKLFEQFIEKGLLTVGVTSPASRIRELSKLAREAGNIEQYCMYIINFLEQLYESFYSDNPKLNALRNHLESSQSTRIAFVVPKAYFADILLGQKIINSKKITIMTANRFDNSTEYDEIIVAGNFLSKRFDPVKCKSVGDITVLLYDCEAYWFEYRVQNAKKFEEKLNSRLDINQDDQYDSNSIDIKEKVNDIDIFINSEVELEEYINNISVFDISNYSSNFGSTGETLMSEVCAIGQFVSDEKILFSKYYKAVVFDSSSGIVSEVSVVDLAEGDQLVFLKRDGTTRNMVDFIYENLKKSGFLSPQVLDATEKANYWKEILREYKESNRLTYGDIAMRLRKLGSSLQEGTIRQWLIEDSHIIGPRNEITLRHIAELTQDSKLLDASQSYFQACRIVRRQRLEILEFIGKAIMDKLSGNKPPIGSIFEKVYNNVENLSEILEIAKFKLIDKPVTVPNNIINKPLIDWEVYNDK